MPSFKLVGSDKDKQNNRKNGSPKDETPESLHFPDQTPWGAKPDQADSGSDILESIERQIDRAQEALDRLSDDADVLFRFSDPDEDDDSPTAA